jgi:hypothetical protein
LGLVGVGASAAAKAARKDRTGSEPGDRGASRTLIDTL